MRPSGAQPVRASLEAPDLSTVAADLRIPEIREGAPGAGKRVRYPLIAGVPQVVLYLPTDWAPDKEFPVLVELAGNGRFRNAFGDVCTGLPEDSRLGYGLSGGKGFLWVCLPFLNGSGNAVAETWWGDAPDFQPTSTVEFIKKAVPAVCERFAGDSDRVILCGFSRGSIAVNAIGLHNDRIAGLWCGFVCYSHYDGVHPDWPFAQADKRSALARLARLAGRPQLVCHETDHGKLNLQATRRHLEASGITGDFTFIETGFRNHNDAWVLRPSHARKVARDWLARVVAR